MISLLAFLSFLSNEPPHIKANNRFSQRLIKCIEKEHGVRCFMKGGKMMDKIEEIDLSFLSSYDITNEAAEKIFVDIMNYILNSYNSDEKIRPYLVNYPFKSSNIELSLHFEDRNEKGQILSMSKLNDNVIYRISNGNSTFHRERESYSRLYQSVYGTSQAK